MKHAYLYMVLVLATLFSMPTVRAQRAWRPLRPGLIYVFSGPGSGSAHTLRLTDALGRTLWQAAVSVGRTALAVPLAGQPAGCYLMHLSGADGTTATWKLNHE